MGIKPATLVLANGSEFSGELIGAEPPDGVVSGEVVFNTVMSGYQEVISDPSYAGQIITFTTTHLGNYGTTPQDDEASTVHCRGVVLRQLARRHSNWRADNDLDSYLRSHNISAIGGVDTRRLTRLIRESGAIAGAFGTAEADVLAAAASAEPGTTGADLVAGVTTASVYSVEGASNRHVVAIDCGMKTTITNHLASDVGRVTVVPASTSAADIMALSPDGVFVSNGPGDPSAVTYVVTTLTELLPQVPVFGICMGHQLLATALGGSTYKLDFGHHGGNHPVKDLQSGNVEITAQNHNYCVNIDGVDGLEATHVNLNDHTLEGFASTKYPAFGVQHHPEAGPGPHDSRYLFERFAALIDAQS